MTPLSFRSFSGGMSGEACEVGIAGVARCNRINVPVCDGVRPLVAPHSRTRQPVTGREQLPPIAS